MLSIAQKRLQATFQAKNREEYKGYTLQPAIGETGGVENIGYEVVNKYEPTRYLGSLELAKHWVDGHLGR